MGGTKFKNGSILACQEHFFASNLLKHIIIDTIGMARRQKKADVHVCAGKAAAQPFLDIGPSIESSIMPCLCYKQAFLPS